MPLCIRIKSFYLRVAFVFFLGSSFFFSIGGFSIEEGALTPKVFVSLSSEETPSSEKSKTLLQKANRSSISNNEKVKTIRVKRGMSLNQVAKILKEAGYINNIFYFKFLAWLSGSSTQIKSGEYTFKKNISNREILSALVKGKVYLHPITFPEGYNIYEMAKALEKRDLLKRKDFISLCHDPDFIYALLGEKRDSLEGYLFPDTYYVPRPARPRLLIRNMVESFFRVYNKLSKEAYLSEEGFGPIRLNRHEMVILASIIEKETGLAGERNLIASVFYNRLRKKMRLESDPTILYGMMRKAGDLVPLNIRKKDILKKTPYNTYRISGFPAGPISNPGEYSLRAVFKPASSSFFYFVSRNDGSHVFSKTYEEHKKAVDRYQRVLRKK